MTEKYDDILYQILQEEKNLVKFFDAIFGFLRRRTDFYVIADNPKDPLGLPKGMAEKIVYDCLQKYKPRNEKIENVQIESDEMVVEREEECIAEESNEPPPPKKEVPKEKPSNERTQTKHKPDNYNGATYDNYSWSQTITDIDVQVILPANYSPKNLLVNIQNSHISVKLKNEQNPIIEGDLHRKIKAAESIWSIDKNILQIHLDKQMESWWERFLVTEPLLDLQQIDCSRPLEELPEDAQAKIEQLRWDAEQKSKGLPTSKEIEQANLLRKAWNAEGSPFKGTPYNPNLVRFEGQN